MRNHIAAMSPKERWLLFIQEPSDASSSSSSHAGVLTGFILGSSCAGNYRCYELMYAPSMSCSDICISSLSSPSASSHILPIWTLDGRCCYGWCTSCWALRVIYTSYFDPLLISALTMTHYTKKLLSPRLRAAQICGHKHHYLDCSLTSMSI